MLIGGLLFILFLLIAFNVWLHKQLDKNGLIEENEKH